MVSDNAERYVEGGLNNGGLSLKLFGVWVLYTSPFAFLSFKTLPSSFFPFLGRFFFYQNKKTEKTKANFQRTLPPPPTKKKERGKKKQTHWENYHNIPLTLHHNGEIISNFKAAKGFVDQYISDLRRWDEACRGREEV